MAIKTANFERGTAAANVLAADPGSADAWVSVFTGTGSSVIYDTAHAAHGKLSSKHTTGSTATNTQLNWGFSPSMTDHYGRFYLYMTANPSSNVIVFLWNIAAGPRVAKILVTTTGKLRIDNDASVQQGITTNSIALNAWVRVEYHVVNSATVGTVELKLYNSPDSTEETETVITPGYNNQTTTDEVYIGIAGSANIGPFWMDDLLIGATSYPGPAIYTSAPPNRLRTVYLRRNR